MNKWAKSNPKCCRILRALDSAVDTPMASWPTDLLSRGWAMRAALGAAIFVNPKLLCVYLRECRIRVRFDVGWWDVWLAGALGGYLRGRCCSREE